MILDKTNELSNSQAVSTTAASTNVIDLGAPGTVLGGPAALVRDIGPGMPIPLMVQVTGTVTGPGNMVVEVRTCTTASMTGAVTLARTTAMTTAQLTAGYQIPIPVVPLDMSSRYMDVRYVVDSTLSISGISAGIVAGLQTNLVPGR